MDKPTRTTIRSQSSAFVRDIAKKVNEKEEPATPSFNNQDQQKIEEMTNKLREKYSGRKN